MTREEFLAYWLPRVRINPATFTADLDALVAAAVAAERAAKDEALDALQKLIANLPICTMPTCGRVATKAWMRGSDRFCDAHRNGFADEEVPDYPRAWAVREGVALLRRAAKAATYAKPAKKSIS